jgi:hypothetical protein
MEEATLKKIYKKDPGTVVKLIDNELVILPLGEEIEISDLGSFYVLKNKTAVYIWNLIDGKMSVGDIREAITNRFDVDSKKAESDVVNFLNELRKIKAIV